MIGAGGGEQQGFGLGRPAIVRAVSSNAADRLGARAAAGLAGHRRTSNAARAQCRGESLQLGRFADPFPAFERDEARFAAHAIPKSCLSPIQMRPKKPAFADLLAGDQRHHLRAVSGVETTRSAICWPLAIGALTGPL